MIQRRTEKDDAVSPVVGVMLMLVVTIIIAAVVAVFATGVTESTAATPNAVFKVTGVNSGGDWGSCNMTFIHSGGDILQKEDLLFSLNLGNMIHQFDYTTPGVTIKDSKYGLSAGDVILYDSAKDTTKAPYTSIASGYIEWSIIDKKTMNVISSGTTLIVA